MIISVGTYSMCFLIKHSFIKVWIMDYTNVKRKAHVNIECWILTDIRVVLRTVMNTQYWYNISLW